MKKRSLAPRPLLSTYVSESRCDWLTALKDDMEGEIQSATSDYVQKMEVREINEEFFIWDPRNFFALVPCYRQEKIVHLEMLR